MVVIFVSVYAFADVEKEVMKFWKLDGTYEKLKKARAKGKNFFYVDGPPYATGSIHMGTAWNKVIKDTYLRFHRMLGENVWDQPGYDTHGTPIETKVEKNLGFKNKKDIERYGISRFVKKCREFATKHIGIMNDEFANLGVWMDWKRPYLTLDNRYIEGAWYTFRKSFENGYLYKGKYPVHVCPRCETVVAYNEIEYTKQTDNSIYVKFRVKGRGNKYLVIWTTTPWTLPGNTGIMVHPKFTYVEAEMGNGEIWIVAKERLQPIADAIEAGYRILQEFPGKKLEGLTYEPPLRSHMKMPKMKDAHRVILSDRYVNLDDGTGLVHTAPGHGKEDFDEGMKQGLPAICPVNIDGSMTKETGKYSGKKARIVDEEIVDDLQHDGVLVYKHPYTHDYPVCWRCSTPLLQVGIDQWFFRVTAVRNKLLSENRKVNWFPGWAGERFNDWLENLQDWPISRQRYWGIPLPIWECECGEIKVIGSFRELRRESGLKKEIDFHRPHIDEVRLHCSECEKEMNRVPDVLDVWFDSGVATWASIGYPREKQLFAKMWPSTFQTEGPDQFRGWWNSQMITSVLTFGKTPFRNVMMHGFVMDVKGIKLSKSTGNFVDPQDILDKYGRDVFRLYVMGSPVWNDFYFSWDDIKEVSRMFTVFWNTYSFIKLYAPKPPKTRPGLKVEDEWIMSRINNLMDTRKDAEKYEMHKIVQAVKDFLLEDFSRVYIKIIRDRVNPWYTGKDKGAAAYALNYVFENLLKVISPVIPFITDHIYRDLYGKQSIHLSLWPEADRKLMKKRLEAGMEVVKELTEAASALRHEKSMKLRWPVKELLVKGDKSVANAVSDFREVIKGMANVKSVKVVTRKPKDAKAFSKGSVSLGEVLMDEAMLREFCRNVQIKRKEQKLLVKDNIKLWVSSDEKAMKALKRQEPELLLGVGAKSVTFGDFEGDGKGSVKFGKSVLRFEFEKA
ncbi:MAG: isoleucine--tRNA ligase [Candidatus Aenigmatarchaeota archaeon]|nr:MAG: isoleucine--tRNA ligase [Candidatus Aenigmarchaeota archaeon]